MFMKINPIDIEVKRIEKKDMAFSFRAGTNWCHDFPKLARESGFYFNEHRTHVRIDWNQISGIDIDRVIRERDFFIIDDNINNVVDYHLETEYDVKILDSNFVKLFRLAQLSVEYLLYCKQYLDHSVIILKDELRSKLEENVKLKKELSLSENNMKELKEKFRDKHKYIEKRFGDSHGEIHKCPFCPKTFIADIFMNSHITRRHSNVSQMSVTSPVHEQYKAEAEKLHNEIKTLKERLNETERLIRSESSKLCDSMDSGKDRLNDIKNNELERSNNTKDIKLEEEHKRYRDEMNHLTTLLFSEIRSLKQDEKKSVDQNQSDNDNVKELLKQQENEIHRLREQVRQLSTKKPSIDIETIQKQLNTQENYWQSKIEHLESQHRSDIEALYAQLKKTQASADFIKADYISKIDELEKSKNDQLKSSDKLEPVVEQIKESSEQRQVEIIDRKVNKKDILNSDINLNDCEEIFIEDVDKISDTNNVNTSTPVNKFHRITVSTIDSVDNSTITHVKKNVECKNLHTLKPSGYDFQKSLHSQTERKSNQSNTKTKNISDMNRSKHDRNVINHKSDGHNVINKHQMDVSSSESDDSESTSEITSESETSESNGTNHISNVNHSLTEDETTDVSTNNKPSQINTRLKNKDELKLDIQEALEQKLRDLGVDPEWKKIPNATYQQLIHTVQHHHSINKKKYPKFENIRQKVIKQLNDNISLYQKNTAITNINDTMKKSPNEKSIIVKSKTFKSLKNQNYRNSHTPKLKSQIGSSYDKSVHPVNKLNIELLPKKISQSEFREPTSPVIRPLPSSQKQQIYNNNNNSTLSLPIEDRYTLEPRELNRKSMESIDMKQLSHSYESIKDYMKDNDYRKINSPVDISGPITTSTPQRDYANILPSHRIITAEVSSRVPNPDELISSFNSPKNSKSVLKSTTGSTGSLVKKKVLFDLQTDKNASDEIIQSKNFDIDNEEQIDVKQNDSEEDFEISNISEEKSDHLIPIETKNSNNIVLRTSQSAKIAELSKKLDTKLSSIRHKPLGGIETMFTKGLSIEVKNERKEQPFDRSINVIENDNSKLSTIPVATKLPQPTPRTTKLTYAHTVTSDHKQDSNDSNLEMDIEELLREN